MTYKVTAMVGDYFPDCQPYWEVEFPDLPSAVVAADDTWQWLWNIWIPAQPQRHLIPYRLTETCVFVIDSDDECGEDPAYVRGNPEARKL